MWRMLTPIFRSFHTCVYVCTCVCACVCVLQVSMFPLLERDGLSLPYIALSLIWAGLIVTLWAPHVARELTQIKPITAKETDHEETVTLGRWILRLLGFVFIVVAVGVHVAQHVFPPPERLPWLYDRAYVTLSFVGLALIMLYMQVAQWWLPPQVTYKWDEQERTALKKDL